MKTKNKRKRTIFTALFITWRSFCITSNWLFSRKHATIFP